MIVGRIVRVTCEKCGDSKDAYLSGDNVNCKCGGLMTPMIDNSVKIFLGIDTTIGYFDEQLDTYIDSTSDRRRIMKERNLECAHVDELREVRSRVQNERKVDNRERLRTIVEREAYRLR